MLPKHLQDGSVLPSGIPVEPREPNAHYKKYGLYKGVVLDVYYPDDDKNSNGERLEYEIRVDGHRYTNVIDVSALGGIYNYSQIVRKIVEKTEGKESSYDNKLDGEIVVVGFLDGNSNVPIIMGGIEHNRHPEYTDAKLTRALGRRARFEYNGMEVEVDKDGTLTISQVGLKDFKEGEIQNPDAVGAKFSINGLTGDILIQDSDTSGNNKIEIVGGVLTINVSGDVNITTAGAANITSTGDATVKTDGNATIDAAAISLKSALNIVPGGVVVAENAANNDPITGVPLTPVGGVMADA